MTIVRLSAICPYLPNQPYPPSFNGMRNLLSVAARQAHAVLTDHIAWTAVRSRAVLADHWIGRIADQAVQRIAFRTFRREYRELVLKIHVGIGVGIAFGAEVPTLLFIHVETGPSLGRAQEVRAPVQVPTK